MNPSAWKKGGSSSVNLRNALHGSVIHVHMLYGTRGADLEDFQGLLTSIELHFCINKQSSKVSSTWSMELIHFYINKSIKKKCLTWSMEQVETQNMQLSRQQVACFVCATLYLYALPGMVHIVRYH